MHGRIVIWATADWLPSGVRCLIIIMDDAFFWRWSVGAGSLGEIIHFRMHKTFLTAINIMSSAPFLTSNQVF